MPTHSASLFVAGLMVLTTTVLAGCTTAPKTLYQWADYEGMVYEYLKGHGESTEAQTSALERRLGEIDAQGHIPPPGYQAHLGLLYSVTGREDLLVRQLQKEKAQFPESTPFIDFLLRTPLRKEVP